MNSLPPFSRRQNLCIRAAHSVRYRRVIPPGSLDADRHVMPISVTHSLECEERLGRFDEHLCDAHLEFLGGDVCVLQDLLGAGFIVTSPCVLSSVRALSGRVGRIAPQICRRFDVRQNQLCGYGRFLADRGT